MREHYYYYPLWKQIIIDYAFLSLISLISGLSSMYDNQLKHDACELNDQSRL